MEELRANLKNKKRVVVKIGSSSLQHPETGELDYIKIDILVRELCNLQNQGKDVILVTSGSISCGRKAIGLKETKTVSQKQACAAIGQARLMTTYQKIFSEYNHYAAQILMTRNTIVDNVNRFNAQNTFNSELANAYPLWVAQYGVTSPNTGNWSTYEGFQYSDNGIVPGISGYTDMDSFTDSIFLTSTENIATPENTSNQISS